MAKLIDAAKADIRDIECGFGCSTDLWAVEEWFNALPAVDAVEVVHGRWERTSKYDEEASVQCSRCLMVFDYIDGLCYLVDGAELPLYCPNCGAKMDGGKKTNV